MDSLWCLSWVLIGLVTRRAFKYGDIQVVQPPKRRGNNAKTRQSSTPLDQSVRLEEVVDDTLTSLSMFSIS